MPFPGDPVPQGYQQLTVSTVAVSLTVPRNASVAIIQVDTQPVRWRDDGTDPTAAVGVPQVAASVLEYQGDLSTIKFIRSGAVDATLNVSYYAS